MRLPIHFGGELGQESALCGKATTPPEFTAIARYPSSLISQSQCAPRAASPPLRQPLYQTMHSVGPEFPKVSVIEDSGTCLVR
jgi:hypothetical protein